jgi:hypothetical protein
MLSHSSGLAYDVFNPSLQKWRRSRREEAQFIAGSLIYQCTAPLVFEPGEEFAYGSKSNLSALSDSKAWLLMYKSGLRVGWHNDRTASILQPADEI